MRKLVVAGLLTVVLYSPEGATAQDTLENPVTGFHLSLMRANDLQNDFMGWIELQNGNKAAGYIYIQNGPPMEPHLSFNKDYIVMDIPTEKLATVLEVLRSDKPISIRYSGFGSPSAFLEVGPNLIFDAEQTKLVKERFGVTLPAD